MFSGNISILSLGANYKSEMIENNNQAKTKFLLQFQVLKKMKVRSPKRIQRSKENEGLKSQLTKEK